MNIHKNQSGFGALPVLLILIIIGIISFTGWYVWHAKQDTEKTLTANQSDSPIHKDHAKVTPQPQPEANTTIHTLADGSITLTTAKTWTKDGVGCVKRSSAFGDQVYLDSAAFLPGEKLITVYGSGTEYFHVKVCVFGNPNNLTPETWYADASKGGIGEGISSSSDTVSTSDINGYPAYYRKENSTNGSDQILSYVLSVKGKIVYVWATTYEVDKSLPGVGEFRQFETSIDDLVKSIKG